MGCISPLDSAVLLEITVDRHPLHLLVPCFAVQVVDLEGLVRVSSNLQSHFCLYLTFFTIEAAVHNWQPAYCIARFEAFSFGADLDDCSTPFVALDNVSNATSSVKP